MLHIGIACAITKPTHKVRHANFNQDLPKDVFFILDLSDIEDINDVTNSNYVNLKPKKIIPHIIKSNKLPPGCQIVLNESDNVGNHEYFLVVDTKILSLVNDVENNTVDKDNFLFLDQPTELAMDNCATFYVWFDYKLFIRDIKETPNIRVKGVSGISQASDIGKIKFTITDKEGRHKEILLKNVIYLPESPKNLISISRWSDNKSTRAV